VIIFPHFPILRTVRPKEFRLDGRPSPFRLVAGQRPGWKRPRPPILGDEPTSHLDLANTRRILRIMRRLRDQGKTIVLTTHDPNTASVSADRIVLLNNGRVAAMGTPAEVVTGERLSRVYDVEIDVRMIDGLPHVLAARL
jgi:ABC-type cobalamin/Fe3+-siderophores transport system ATPase subunit